MASLSPSSRESDNWLLGTNLRKLDRYIQTAGPVRPSNWQSEVISPYTLSLAGGRERHHLERWSKRARYSLVVSIRTPEEEVDLYTPVVNMIRPQIEIIF